MLIIEGASVSYGRRVVMDRVSASLGPDPVAITGPSGSGKSTLLRVLAGHQSLDRGDVTLHGTPVVRRTWSRSSDTRIAFVHQDYQLVPYLKVVDNVRLACELRGVEASASTALEALGQVGLSPEHADRWPETLSGGEQQRVAIARAVACGSDVLIADEPTGALDTETTLQIAALLTRLATERDMLVLVATHDPVVAEVMPRRFHLADGRLGELA
ncbi:ABC transporter ATP-binding protein [Pimelobacter sp. 30-1]|uniref:ABC transporter ATP-binding protein n=1 Tax=Pimelobacter sp. 30-1 TaxID=2004991 RepID=UPI001C040A9E|nr:ATP-binding cassette domain-containing protein [Pimelobacter sp. 30-1]MBU2696788.1 hypothetical protein [Pimelobacter sp. 30-1]